MNKKTLRFTKNSHMLVKLNKVYVSEYTQYIFCTCNNYGKVFYLYCAVCKKTRLNRTNHVYKIENTKN